MIYVLRGATLHGHKPPLMIFVFFIVPLHAHGLPLVTFGSHVVTYMLHPRLDPFVHCAGIDFFYEKSNLGGSFTTFIVKP